MRVIVETADCHPSTCLDVASSGGEHTANVNPTSSVNQPWRVDCDDCGTCVSLHATKGDALIAATEHVQTARRS